VELRELAGEALDLVRGMAAERAIELRVDLHEAEDTYVMADRQRLRQVLVNLLSNAVKYNRQEAATTLSSREDGSTVRIEVTDAGPGIPHDRIDRLFSPFERLGAEQGDVEGTGLGLAVSKRLVEAMGARSGWRRPPRRGRPSSWSFHAPSRRRAHTSLRRRPARHPHRRRGPGRCSTSRTTCRTSR
jgi:signal transduction histidine kinase